MSKTSLRYVADALPPSRREVRDSRLTRKVGADELPGGVYTKDFSRSEFADALMELKIPGVTAANSREANQALYESHLQGIHDDAGEEALLSWFLDREDEANKRDDEKRGGERKDGDE